MNRERPSAKPLKILIIRFSSLGDVVLSNPLIQALRDQFPDARIDFLVRREYEELVKYHPALHRVRAFEAGSGFSGLLHLRREIRTAQYDIILDIHRSLRSSVLLAGGRLRQKLRRLIKGAPGTRIYRIKKDQLLRFLLVHFKINLYRKKYGRIIPVWEKYLRTAAPLGLSAAYPPLRLYYPEETDARVTEHLSRKNIVGPFIVVAPGARHFTKRWPAEYYARLIKQIHGAFNMPAVLVGGEEDLPVIREIQDRAGDIPIYSVAGELSILQTAELIRRARLMICNDSGLMHIAAAQQTPLIAIFGSTTEELGFFPYSATATVIENKGLSCRPCSHIGRESCPKGHFKCMKEILPETVFLIAREKLAKR